ncbi:HipA domain-containing protein [Arthrobacter agilis]|uniref:type II toxin-antitoxin system HipA family toxin n=1 Tax=Arthrobacter agilis TaxID=37921 RepID=UPI0023654100|nr:HipA domain-containing protein [Arthrobacter agilis]WDF33735.1 HipA domain-containing protein [Arthrobacter agilis]
MKLVNVERLRIDIQDPTGSWNEFGFLSSQEDINWFTPSDSYWELEHRPIVGQYFEERGEYWSPAQTRVALPHWFGHLLPEGMLRELVAQRLAVHESRDFQLLRALGEDDLPGALRAISVASDGSEASVEEHLADETADPYDPDFKFSLAGVQLKFSVFASARAITLPVKGQAGNGILKTPYPRPGFKNVPESEYAVMNLARMAGMQVAPTRLVTVTEILSSEYWSGAGSTTGLLIDRFDRTSENQRIHAEQFAQVMWIPARRDGAKYKYANFETVANLVGGVVGIDAVAEVIDRIVLNVLVGNGDAHLKNWSFIYPDGRNAKLSPA